MPSVTLAESAKLALNELAVGVIQSVITVDQMYEVLPFDGIEGNALAYNRENALGGAGVIGVGQTIGTDDKNPILATTGGGKNAATFSQVTSSLTTILGDAEVNGLIQVTRSQQNDQAAVQIASKAKHVGRLYRHMLVNGDTGSDPNEFDGLLQLVTAGQTVDSATNGSQLALAHLDELMDLVTAKDGQVDFFVAHARERRAYRTLLRALGGAAIMEVVELPSGDKVIAYSGVPMFRNDYMPIDQTQGAATNAASILAGCFDDGSRSLGIAGLTAAENAGMHVEDVGVAEGKDEHIWRVKWYAGLALFSDKGLAMKKGLIP